MNTYQFSALLAALLLPVSALAQGPLPPPGAPGPTMKTLDQIDAKLEKRIPISSIPFDITKPGSYYLTQNLSGAAPGITAKVSGVTIDLNGFTITGPGKGLAGTGSGIVGLDDTVVRNGRISDFGDDGVRVGGACVVENLDIVNIGGACINAGEQARVRNCRVGAGAQGIVVGLSSIIDSCTSIGNTGASPSAGIAMASYGTISNSISSYNTGDGISVGSGDAVTHCVVANNNGGGIVALIGAKVSECTSRSNKGIGVNVGTGSTVKRCTITDYGTTSEGIRATTFCVILENHVEGTPFASNDPGIHIISLGSGNTASNRIEGNEVFVSNPGIQVDSTNNLVIRNSVGSGGSSPYKIAAANSALVVRGTVNSSPIDGQTGGAAIGTTDPWANIAF